MASSPLRSKSYHTRSVSLPSRSHSLIPQFNEHLCRLTTSEAAFSLPSISNRLSGLQDLYDSVDHLLLLSQTQQLFAQECNQKGVEEALDGYLRLLEACAASKDIFSQTREDVKEELSTLRRKRDTCNFGGYLSTRRKAKKAIQKLMKELKSIESKDVLLALDRERETFTTLNILKEVEVVTLTVLESLLSYAAGTKVQSRGSGWSLVSKMMHHKSAAVHAKEIVTSEFEMVDATVQALIGHKPSKRDDNKNIENVQKQLGELELSIEDLEEALDRLLRRLIKTRVSLLNILNH